MSLETTSPAGTIYYICLGTSGFEEHLGVTPPLCWTDYSDSDWQYIHLRLYQSGWQYQLGRQAWDLLNWNKILLLAIPLSGSWMIRWCRNCFSCGPYLRSVFCDTSLLFVSPTRHSPTGCSGDELGLPLQSWFPPVGDPSTSIEEGGSRGDLSLE